LENPANPGVVSEKIGLTKPEEASTHKRARTHAGTVFMPRDVDL